MRPSPAFYTCTRCGLNEIRAAADGCTRGPCPMELTHTWDRFWFWLTGQLP